MGCNCSGGSFTHLHKKELDDLFGRATALLATKQHHVTDLGVFIRKNMVLVGGKSPPGGATHQFWFYFDIPGGFAEVAIDVAGSTPAGVYDVTVAVAWSILAEKGSATFAIKIALGCGNLIVVPRTKGDVGATDFLECVAKNAPGCLPICIGTGPEDPVCWACFAASALCCVLPWPLNCD